MIGFCSFSARMARPRRIENYQFGFPSTRQFCFFRRPSGRPIIFALVLIALTFCFLEAVGVCDSPEFDAILSKIQSEREKLESWHVTISWTKKCTAGEKTTEDKLIELEYWLDGNRWRIDRSEMRINSGPEAFEGLASNKFSESSKRYENRVVRNADGFFVVGPSTDFLQIDEPTANDYTTMFDVRALGLGLLVALNHQLSLTELVQGYQFCEFPKNVNLDGDYATLTIGPYDSKLLDFFEIVVNLKDGATPTKVRLFEGSDQQEAEIANVEWSLKKDLWVPSRFVYALKGRKMQREWELIFEWKSVNESIDDDVFDLRKINPKAKFVLRDVGKETVATKLFETELVRKKTTGTGFRPSFIFGSVMVCLILLYIFRYQGKKA